MFRIDQKGPVDAGTAVTAAYGKSAETRRPSNLPDWGAFIDTIVSIVTIEDPLNPPA